MHILEPFEDREVVQALTARIAELAAEVGAATFMEVCGSHTQAIGRWGIRGLLPDGVRLVSGPGCPVCVTPGDYIDNACRLALERGVTIATFGDMIRVPGLETSLEEARSLGARVQPVYSPMDALALAHESDDDVVFLAIGFETTIAPLAATIRAADAQGVGNLTFYTSMRLVPPALAALLADPALRLDGFLLPGHVSVIIGTQPYALLAEHGRPGVIVGFEPVEILAGIEVLLGDMAERRAALHNLYPQVVHDDGNPIAQRLMADMFDVVDAAWRGLGEIPRSGYRLKAELAHLDAARRYSLPPLSAQSLPGCACGDVLRGACLPPDCPLFGKSCTPTAPVGPCMVSGEGSCAAWYKYE
jgi:hydrogenase expression/formation protein HypD